MNNYLIKSFFMSVLALVSSSCFSQNTDAASAEVFFNRYVELGQKFDESLSDMYSDEAVIYLKTNNSEEGVDEIIVGGKKYKSLIKQVMPKAKEVGDINNFTNIKISTMNNTATIKAHRYSELHCATDKSFYMILERDESGNYKIIEEHISSVTHHKCTSI